MKLSLLIAAIALVGCAGPSVASRPNTPPREKANGTANAAAQREASLDEQIRALEQKVVAAQFQDAPSLVRLAALQMKRDGATPEAKLNIQRALAIDDNSMPAYDQLAQWYLRAKRLELAALVCSQAIKKQPSYAPIHLTAGLVEYESKRVNSALAEFAIARKLDPTLFDAHMNIGLVNLGFRGFEQAREAFEQAIRLRPNDYDAHLGMAVALRGPLTGMEPDLSARIDAVQAELDAAKKIDPKRPDAFFNEAILTQEFRSKSSNVEETKATLRLASRTFETFVAMAADSPRYEVSVKRARGRIADIGATLTFLSQ